MGTMTYVCYVGEDLYHERLVVGWVEASEYVILTPDFDLYIEQLDAGNGDLGGLRVGDAAGTVPLGLSGADIYSFQHRPSGAALAGVLREGAALAATERQARGLVGVAGGGVVPGSAVAPEATLLPLLPEQGAAPPGLVRVPGVLLPEQAAGVPGSSSDIRGRFDEPRPAPRKAGAAGAWVLSEPGSRGVVGQEVVLPPAAVDFGGRAFVCVDGELRTVSFVGAGRDLDGWARERLGVLAAGDARVCEQPDPDALPTLAEANARMAAGPRHFRTLKGPATVSDSLASILQRTAGGGFTAYHDRWVVESRIDGTHRSKHEHRFLCRALQLAATEDGLNLKGLVVMEYLNRRRLLLEEAHREDAARPNWEASHLYMGEEEDAPGVAMSAALRAHVAAEMGREAAIMKERRKAREARASGGRKKGDSAP